MALTLPSVRTRPLLAEPPSPVCVDAINGWSLIVVFSIKFRLVGASVVTHRASSIKPRCDGTSHSHAGRRRRLAGRKQCRAPRAELRHGACRQ